MGPNATPSHQIQINNGKFEHSTFDPSVPGLKVVTGTSTIQSNTWYHVAIMASAGGKMHLYVNGVEEGNPVDITNLFAGGDRFHIGDPSNSGAFGYFNGLIDDVRIYQQALSISDIQGLYADIPATMRLQFDNSAYDSANSNNGTLNGGTSYAVGKIEQAISLDGSTGYVNIPYDASSVTAYTISGWVKPTDTTNVNVFVLTDNVYGPTLTASHQIRINGAGKFEHSTYDQGAGSMKVVTGTTTVQANTWYHVAIVAKAGDTMRLYVNGVEENSLGLNNPVSVNGLFSGGDRFQIGVAAYSGVPGSPTDYFTGLVDDVRFYRQVLTASQLAALYRSHAYADDDFESNTVSGGFGWGGIWALANNGSSTASIVSTGSPNSGTYHLLLTGNGASATRAADLTGVVNARLVFDWKANDFEAGESAVVEIFDGTAWITVFTINDGSDDNTYHHTEISLAKYKLTSNFQVRFRSLMSASDDFFYIDDLQIAR